MTSSGWRVDRRTPEEISALIQWSQRDNFWKSNILSMGKLREKFDQLALKQNAERENNANGNRKPTIFASEHCNAVQTKRLHARPILQNPPAAV